jgi:hypothetical protein
VISGTVAFLTTWLSSFKVSFDRTAIETKGLEQGLHTCHLGHSQGNVGQESSQYCGISTVLPSEPCWDIAFAYAKQMASNGYNAAEMPIAWPLPLVPCLVPGPIFLFHCILHKLRPTD